MFQVSKLDSLIIELGRTEVSPFQNHVNKVIRWKYQMLLGDSSLIFPYDGTVLIPEERSIDKAIYSLYYGEYLNDNGAYDTIAFPYYTEAIAIGEQLQDSLILCEALKRMIFSIGRDQEKKVPGILNKISAEYRKYAYDDFEKDLSNLLYWRSLSAIRKKPFLEEFIKGEKIAFEHGNPYITAYYLKLIGVKYDVYAGKLRNSPDSVLNRELSLEYYRRSLSLFETYLPAYFAKRQINGLNINVGVNYFYQRKFIEADKYLKVAQSRIFKEDEYHINLLNYWFAANFDSLGVYDSALYYRNREMNYLKRNYARSVDLSVAEIYARFETEKKQRKIETQETTIALKNRTQIISTTLLVVIISLLVLRSRAARRAATQDKKLHSQEINQLMANQELRMIQAAIDAEEKERERMAEDLHDRLGSTLSATRMHMDVLEEHIEEGSESQASRIKDLLDKAIEDTRQISHNMLSGVLTKFGLKAAIEDLKQTVVNVNNLQVYTYYNDFDFSLPKEVEIQTFRVIQELMSNVLKHAHAENVTITFKQSESGQQLVFSDDGLGFDVNSISNGIGLKNIQSRLDKINADYSFTSDTRGTTVTVNFYYG